MNKSSLFFAVILLVAFVAILVLTDSPGVAIAQISPLPTSTFTPTPIPPTPTPTDTPTPVPPTPTPTLTNTPTPIPPTPTPTVTPTPTLTNTPTPIPPTPTPTDTPTPIPPTPTPTSTSTPTPIPPTPTPNRPPICASATSSVSIIWPPNHKFAEINVLNVTDPEGHPVSVVIDGIFQDEVVNALGDGNTDFDAQGVGTSTALVRAERQGDRNGRVYHILFTADDGFGGVCSGEITVGVPHSETATPVDEGPLFDSTQP